MRLLGWAILAQWADLTTWDAAREANPIVVALGDAAPLFKLAMAVTVVMVCLRLESRGERPAARLVAAVLLVAGLVGAATNILAAP